jgi:hypothetical protein
VDVNELVLNFEQQEQEDNIIEDTKLFVKKFGE